MPITALQVIKANAKVSQIMESIKTQQGEFPLTKEEELNAGMLVNKRETLENISIRVRPLYRQNLFEWFPAKGEPAFVLRLVVEKYIDELATNPVQIASLRQLFREELGLEKKAS